MATMPKELVFAKMLSRLAVLQQVRALTHPQRMEMLRELLELADELELAEEETDETP